MIAGQSPRLQWRPARGPAVTKEPGADVSWSDLVHQQTFKVPFWIRSDILESDEAIIAVIAHEIFELERLREIFAEEGRMFLEHFHGHTRPGNPGNLHDEAWDFADTLVERYRKEGKPWPKELRRNDESNGI
jgi:hypothetical protein